MDIFTKVTPIPCCLQRGKSLERRGKRCWRWSWNNYHLVYLWVYRDMCVHRGAHVYAYVCICHLSEKKKFLPDRTFLSWLLSYHHLWAWKMPTYFNNISHTFVGRQRLLWKEIMWRISKPQIKNFEIICCFEWSGPSPSPICRRLGSGCTFYFLLFWPILDPSGPFQMKPVLGAERADPGVWVASLTPTEPMYSSINSAATSRKPS